MMPMNPPVITARTLRRLFAALFFLLLGARGAAVEWPAEDRELDRLLRRESPKYAGMAAAVEQRGGYRIESVSEVRLGMVMPTPGGLVIQLNPGLTAERRATILIWEMANAFQRPRFDAIDRRAAEGKIASAQEFGLRMEIIEYDSFRHHREVLEELAARHALEEGALLFFINPALKKLADYALPYAFDYIEAQAASGHTGHYESWYGRQKAPQPVSVPAASPAVAR